MLAYIRLLVVALVLIVISVFACLYSILRPFHKNNVYVAANIMAKMRWLLGIEIELRIPEHIKDIGPVVYVGNHQNSWDIFTLANAVRPNSVSVGKKSIKWIPFFGQMYWLTGNILIDRTNTSKAHSTITQTAKKIREKQLSVWLFPEGTRSNGRGVLPFKTGAFRTAMQANVPIVPVCVSNCHNKIDLNRWDNGKVIIEFMEPIAIDQNGDKEYIRSLANNTREAMRMKFAQLNEELGDTELLDNVQSMTKES